MSDWWYSFIKTPYIDCAIVGGIFFVIAVVSTRVGKTLLRFGGTVCRAKDPIMFWFIVTIYYLCGVIGVIEFLFKVKF